MNGAASAYTNSELGWIFKERIGSVDEIYLKSVLVRRVADCRSCIFFLSFARCLFLVFFFCALPLPSILIFFHSRPFVRFSLYISHPSFCLISFPYPFLSLLFGFLSAYSQRYFKRLTQFIIMEDMRKLQPYAKLHQMLQRRICDFDRLLRRHYPNINLRTLYATFH